MNTEANPEVGGGISPHREPLTSGLSASVEPEVVMSLNPTLLVCPRPLLVNQAPAESWGLQPLSSARGEVCSVTRKVLVAT